MNLGAVFDSTQPLVGMVHLPPLPGAPGYGGDRETIHKAARADARALAAAGFDGLLVENFGDRPYHPETVPPHVVAELAAILESLDGVVDCPTGVNVLRNDATAALSVAAAADGSFVRVNVHAGVRETDQGLLGGQAHETTRLRSRIDADVAILADVAVKHSAAVGDRSLADRSRELVDRGLADGLVVSGPATGEPAVTADLQAVLDGRDDATREVPVFVGSGVTAETVADVLDHADGAIVGTALKREAVTSNRVDPARACAVVDAVRD